MPHNLRPKNFALQLKLGPNVTQSCFEPSSLNSNHRGLLCWLSYQPRLRFKYHRYANLYGVLFKKHEINAAFTFNGFDNQERNLTFVKMTFQVLKFKFHACSMKQAFFPVHRQNTARAWQQEKTFLPSIPFGTWFLNPHV